MDQLTRWLHLRGELFQGFEGWFLLFVLEIFSPKSSPGVLERGETLPLCTVLGNYSAVMFPR